jgi:hypothetical protein
LNSKGDNFIKDAGELLKKEEKAEVGKAKKEKK